MQDEIPVPCGKCPTCRATRISSWSFRLMQEHKDAKSAFFLTLTYDTTHIPISRAGFMELKKRDLQLFFKRLRKASEKTSTLGKIKYYAVGEYGGRTNRPHYHIIMFNAKLDLISPAWNKGQVHYGHVNEASVGYTLKYMSKPTKIPMHRNDDRTKEFSLMSKYLGARYLTEAMVRWHKEWTEIDPRMYCNIEDGKKIAMPRYYKNKIYTDDERTLIGYYSQKMLLDTMKKEIEQIGIEQFNKNLDAKKLGLFKKVAHQSKNRQKI